MSEGVVQLLQSIDRRLVDLLADSQLRNGGDPQKAYTRQQAARLIGVSTWTIDRARKQGLLIEARRFGQRDVRITGESLVRFMNERESASAHVRKM